MKTLYLYIYIEKTNFYCEKIKKKIQYRTNKQANFFLWKEDLKSKMLSKE